MWGRHIIQSSGWCFFLTKIKSYGCLFLLIVHSILYYRLRTFGEIIVEKIYFLKLPICALTCKELGRCYSWSPNMKSTNWESIILHRFIDLPLRILKRQVNSKSAAYREYKLPQLTGGNRVVAGDWVRVTSELKSCRAQSKETLHFCSFMSR